MFDSNKWYPPGFSQKIHWCHTLLKVSEDQAEKFYWKKNTCPASGVDVLQHFPKWQLDDDFGYCVPDLKRGGLLRQCENQCVFAWKNWNAWITCCIFHELQIVCLVQINSLPWMWSTAISERLSEILKPVCWLLVSNTESNHLSVAMSTRSWLMG